MRSWRNSTVAVLVSTGSLLAAFGGIAVAGVGGDNGAATGHSAQQPLGTLSATPEVTFPREETTSPEQQVLPDITESPAELSPGQIQTLPVTDTQAGPAGDSLPFTGFLALGAVGLGLLLLASGVALRLRVGRPAAGV